jgi:hypothetical protein
MKTFTSLSEALPFNSGIIIKGSVQIILLKKTLISDWLIYNQYITNPIFLTFN